MTPARRSPTRSRKHCEYAAAAQRYFGPDQGAAWVAQLPADMRMWRIAVRPEVVRILDFETRFPSALSS